MRNSLLSLAMAGLLNCSPVAALPLVQNGDFAVDFASGALPWFPTGTVTWNTNAAHFVAFGSTGTLTQTGTTALAVGDPYRLTFDVRTGASNQNNSLTIFYGITSLAVFTNVVSDFSGVVNFSPTTPLDFLRFSFTENASVTLQDISVDNIALVDLNANGVPEIDLDSIALPLAAAFLLLAIRRGQNQKGRKGKDATLFA